MFDFHSNIFCSIYVIISFCCCISWYFKILFCIADENKVMSNKKAVALAYGVGILFSAFASYYLFQLVRFIQFYY